MSPAFLARHDASAGPLYILGQRASGLDVSKSRTIMLNACDSGSEANSESCACIPGPPCGNHLHDRAKAEGFVHAHAGIHGGNGSGLDPATHDWRDPVARLSIKTWKVSR